WTRVDGRLFPAGTRPGAQSPTLASALELLPGQGGPSAARLSGLGVRTTGKSHYRGSNEQRFFLGGPLSANRRRLDERTAGAVGLAAGHSACARPDRFA